MNLFDGFIYDYKRLLVFTKDADIIVQNIDGCKFELCETEINSKDFECWYNPIEKRAAVKTFDGRFFLMSVCGLGLQKKVKFLKKNTLNKIKQVDFICTIVEGDFNYTAREIVNLSLEEIEELF